MNFLVALIVVFVGAYILSGYMVNRMWKTLVRQMLVKNGLARYKAEKFEHDLETDIPL
jgi:hypothetical protein